MARALANATRDLLGKIAINVVALRLLMSLAQVMENVTRTHSLVLVMLVLVVLTAMRKRVLPTELAWPAQVMENVKKVFVSALIVGLQQTVLHQRAPTCAQAMVSVMQQQLVSVSLDGKGKIVLFVSVQEAVQAMENVILMPVVSPASV